MTTEVMIYAIPWIACTILVLALVYLMRKNGNGSDNNQNTKIEIGSTQMGGTDSADLRTGNKSDRFSIGHDVPESGDSKSNG